jgi:hypothetical protein
MYAQDKTSEWLDATAEAFEEKYPEIAVLWVHPDEPRIIRGEPTPNPGVPILILQSKLELMKEKRRLKDLGYYQAWK